jgi:hypothetical protein
MADGSSGSPFSGLDKALLRQTRQQPAPVQSSPTPAPAQDASVIEIPQLTTPPPPPRPQEPAKTVRAYDRTTVRTDDRTDSRRRTVRWPFEFYQDQIDDLQRLSAEAKLSGKHRPMAKMVREAMDEFLAKERKKK